MKLDRRLDHRSAIRSTLNCPRWNLRSRLIYVAAKVLLPPVHQIASDQIPRERHLARRLSEITESESREIHAIVEKPRLILERRQIYVSGSIISNTPDRISFPNRFISILFRLVIFVWIVTIRIIGNSTFVGFFISFLFLVSLQLSTTVNC